MRHYPYLIIGGGMAADAAARGIRQIDSNLSIGLISQEPDPPYNRPPLSKGLWKTTPRPMPLSRIWRGTENLGVDIYLNRKVVNLNPWDKVIKDDQGNEFSYEKLLLATGGDPIKLGVNDDRVIYFRTLKDYHHLRAMVTLYRRFAVIGGGFIGSELAAALISQGKEVTMIFPEEGICARNLPRELSSYVNSTFRDRGVRIIQGQLVNSIEVTKNEVILKTNLGEELHIEAIVAGLGIRPEISLAATAGLQTGDGIFADANMRTLNPDIFTAGDVANFYNPLLGKRMRAEHEENANLSGLIAGNNMAGAGVRYEQLPSVYSSLFDLNYEAVGDLNPNHEIYFDWQIPYQKGVVYYMDNGRVRGVLLWNIARGLDTARELIARTGITHPKDLKNAITG